MDMLAQALGIKNAQAKDAKTHYIVDDAGGARSVVFDDVITKWMKGLYELLKHIAGARESRHIILPDEAVESEYPGNVAPRNQFFVLAETVCNQRRISQEQNFPLMDFGWKSGSDSRLNGGGNLWLLNAI